MEVRGQIEVLPDYIVCILPIEIYFNLLHIFNSRWETYSLCSYNRFRKVAHQYDNQGDNDGYFKWKSTRRAIALR